MKRSTAQFREIMNKWKQDDLTGWREEHERTDRPSSLVPCAMKWRNRSNTCAVFLLRAG